MSHDKKDGLSNLYVVLGCLYSYFSLIEILVVLGIWKMWKLRRRVGRGLVFVSYCNVQQHTDGE